MHSPDLESKNQQQLFVDKMFPRLDHILNCYQHITEYHKPVFKMVSQSNIIGQCEFKTFECPAHKARLMNRIQPQSIDEQKSNNQKFVFPLFLLKKSSVKTNNNLLEENGDDKREILLQMLNLIHCVLFHDPMEKLKIMSKKRGKRFYSLTDLFVSPYANSHRTPRPMVYAASTTLINSPLIS